MNKIGILGSTGSIGRKALDLTKANGSDFELIFISCNRNVTLLKEQSAFYKPKYAILTGVEIGSKIDDNILSGWGCVLEIIKNVEIDFLFVASSGVDCIYAIYEAITRGIKIATANKETIVIAGDILCKLARNKGIPFIPVDSEHSGIFQCLMGQKKEDIKNITLTASGGPFLYKSIEEFHNITVEEALQHPVWQMGGKITIDSATMMNKGFELIEAHYLFDISPCKLDTIIHPQSVIHAIVSFIDGSSIAQLSIPDMIIPISFALHYPVRKKIDNYFLNLAELKELTFMEMDYNKFPLIKIIKEVLSKGYNSYIVAIEVANEISVSAFLKKEISFTTIEYVIKRILDIIKPLKLCTINDILLFRDEIATNTIKLIRGI
jgi:1-deoxy-D-xylulose-5-phosphate reductoisomerase